MLWKAGKLWILAGERLIVHDGTRAIRQLVLCDGVVARSQSVRRYHHGLYVDSQGFVTVGENAKGQPVISRVSFNGKLQCEIREGEYFVGGFGPGGAGIWKAEVNGKLILRTARSGELPSPPGGVPILSRVFAVAKDRVWLEIWGHEPMQESSLVRTLYFDGNRWLDTVPPPSLPIQDVKQAADGTVWALLRNHHSSRIGDLTVAQFDGSTWRVVEAGAEGDSLEVQGKELWLFTARRISRKADKQWQRAVIDRPIYEWWAERPMRDLHTMDPQGRLFMIVAPPPNSKSTSWLLRRFDPPAKTNL